MDSILPTTEEKMQVAKSFGKLLSDITAVRDKLHRGPMARDWAVVNTQVELAQSHFWQRCGFDGSYRYAHNQSGEIAVFPHDDRFLPDGWEWNE